MSLKLPDLVKLMDWKVAVSDIINSTILGDSERDWTAHSVELPLWTVHTAEKIGLPLKISDDEKICKRIGRKRCSTNEEDEKGTVF